jgi:hypothetical protein
LIITILKGEATPLPACRQAGAPSVFMVFFWVWVKMVRGYFTFIINLLRVK